jgi:hypothetical protein
MRISGHLDLCGDTLIEGWLYCEAWDNEPILLQVYIGDKLVGECVANGYREDLQRAGYGDGRCGFSFQIPAELEITEFSETRLRLVDTPVYMLPDEFTALSGSRSPDLGSRDSRRED